jgi:hypothetical protein
MTLRLAYLYPMFRFVTVMAVALAVVALVMPIAATWACDAGHEADCATDCSCMCCSIKAFDCHAPASGTSAPIVQFALNPDPQWLELLLVADVFRPPISL